MWIFIRQVPKKTTRKALNKFVSKGLRPSWVFFPLPPHSKVKRCEILRIDNPEKETTEYHGLVQIDFGRASLPVMERLSGCELQGKRVEVHKYFRRSSYRDRRRVLSQRGEQQEYRRKDRRRNQLRKRVLSAPEIQRILGIL